jgi:hypothetical protein
LKYIIDRFEGDLAVVEIEEGVFTNIPKIALPKEAKEGDIIDVSVDNNETEQRRKNIEKLMENLWAD